MPRTTPSSAAPDRRLLNSWKEIAAHLDRGVRTAQRWEVQYGMPVHRPAGHDRSAVLAFRDELDAWLARTPLRLRDGYEWDDTNDLQQLGRVFAEALGRRVDETERSNLREQLLAFLDTLEKRPTVATARDHSEPIGLAA